MGKLLEELKRRKVFRVAAVYAIVAWLIIQIAGEILPTFDAPQWVNQTIVLVLALGFPLALVLAWAFEMTPQGIKADAIAQPAQLTVQSTDRKLIYAILALVMLVAGFQIAGQFTTAPGPSIATPTASSAITRLSISMPADQDFEMIRGDFDIAEDGSFFVYRGADPETGEPMLWVRDFDSLNARPLPGTSGFVLRPKISPDGSEVVFMSPAGLKVVSIGRGVTRTLLPESVQVPNWSPDGKFIYYVSTGSRDISRIPSAGGEVVVLLQSSPDIEFLGYVDALPDGDKILYQVEINGNAPVIQGLNLSTNETKNIVEGRLPIYSKTGHLLFLDAEEPVLLAAGFDASTMELISEPVPIATNLYQVGLKGTANITVSSTGRLLYRQNGDSPPRRIPMWIDRQGTRQEVDPGWSIPNSARISVNLSISPDGNRLALEVPSFDSSDIWIKELPQGPLSRVTFNDGFNFRPSWFDNGNQLLYASERGGLRSIWSRRADGGGQETPVLLSDERIYGAAYSIDGEWLVYYNGTNLMISATTGEAVPRILIPGDDLEIGIGEFSLSPDGRWLAYVSSETGRPEIYVRPFPDVESGRWLVSSDGGDSPVWSGSSEEFFYLNLQQEMVAVQLNPGSTFSWASQQTLFSFDGFVQGDQTRAFDVTADGQRFVGLQMRSTTEFILVDNWHAELPSGRKD